MTLIDELWLTCGSTPEFERLGVLADAYGEIGETDMQEFLTWCVGEERWPDYRKLPAGEDQYSFWWFDVKVTASFKTTYNPQHSVLPKEYGLMEDPYFKECPFSWFEHPQICFATACKTWQTFSPETKWEMNQRHWRRRIA